MVTIGELIRQVGGATRVARQCGVSPAAVSNWIMRGSIAAEHRITVWRLATEADVDWAPPAAHGLRLEIVGSENSEAA